MDVISKYWPAVVGLIVLLVSYQFLKPDESSGISNRGIVGQVSAPAEDHSVGRDPEEDVEDEDGPPKRPDAVIEPAPEGAPPSAFPEPEYVMVEKVIAVPLEGEPGKVQEFKTKDPVVQAALGEVEVVLWRTKECKHCQAAAEYLDHNKVPYQARYVAHADNREKLLRLSGGTSVPVIQVDGDLVRGFSPGSLQAALKNAVKNRVAAAN